MGEMGGWLTTSGQQENKMGAPKITVIKRQSQTWSGLRPPSPHPPAMLRRALARAARPVYDAYAARAASASYATQPHQAQRELYDRCAPALTSTWRAPRLRTPRCAPRGHARRHTVLRHSSAAPRGAGGRARGRTARGTRRCHAPFPNARLPQRPATAPLSAPARGATRPNPRHRCYFNRRLPHAAPRARAGRRAARAAPHCRVCLALGPSSVAGGCVPTSRQVPGTSCRAVERPVEYTSPSDRPAMPSARDPNADVCTGPQSTLEAAAGPRTLPARGARSCLRAAALDAVLCRVRECCGECDGQRSSCGCAKAVSARVHLLTVGCATTVVASSLPVPHASLVASAATGRGNRSRLASYTPRWPTRPSLRPTRRWWAMSTWATAAMWATAWCCAATRARWRSTTRCVRSRGGLGIAGALPCRRGVDD